METNDCKENFTNNRYYDIETRSKQLGGGYRIVLFEGGEEVGGAVFPMEELSVDEGIKIDLSFERALDFGEAWADPEYADIVGYNAEYFAKYYQTAPDASLLVKFCQVRP